MATRLEREHRLRPSAPPFRGDACRAGDGQRGFTLLEILIASVVIVVGLVAVQQGLGSAWNSYRAAVEADERALALWNLSVEFRQGRTETGQDWSLAEGLRPLRRTQIKAEGATLSLEVVHAR